MIIKSKNISLISALLVTLCPLFDVVAESDYPKTRDERKNDEIGSMVGGGGIIFTPSKTKNESTKQQIHSVNKYLWQASIEILNFAPLASVDSNSGVIITDWYSPKDNPGYNFKINVIIKDDVISPNAITVKIFKKLLKNNTWQEIDDESKLAVILEDKIIRKAREFYINTEGKD
jgi:hypothetical protein